MSGTNKQTASSLLSTTLIIITIAFSYSLATAQTAPLKQWDARFGGNGYDEFSSLEQTADGGFILGGGSSSGISGDKTQASQGNYDYWIVKTDADGMKQWDGRFGGSDYDYLYSLEQTPDDGYILGGLSLSGISGDKTQASQGDYDYWIVKTDANGVKQWDARYGGSDLDQLYALQQTDDGGYILGGQSSSEISGDKTQASQGGDDYWIVKTDSNGVKQWDARFGGSSVDILKSLEQTADGGYILGGQSSSEVSGDKTQASQGSYDYWIVKTDANGVKQWDARFGGSNFDWFYSLQQTADGGYILGGASSSGISGDKTQASQGDGDYWMVKTDANGVKQWDARFGGSSLDNLYSLEQTADGGYILGGYSLSGISGDKTQGSQGSYDYWIVKTDANGVKQWDARFGGYNYDILQSLEQTADGGYMLGGPSSSGIGGDKTQGSQGARDYWIVKVASDCSGGLIFYADTDGDGYGNALVSLFVADCILPIGYVADSTDCDDNNAAINPSATETCNNIDDNCNGSIDDGLIFSTYYVDGDNDGYGDVFYQGDSLCSNPGTGYSTNNIDCDDNNAAINPAAIEICNGLDDDCNSIADDGLITEIYFADADNDGFGNANNIIDSCAQPLGYLTDSTDCDDTNSSVNPDVLEIPNNGIDDDCDGYIDEFGVGISTIDSNDPVLSVFPNPTNGGFTVELQFENDVNDEATIELINILGQFMYKINSVFINGKLNEEISLMNIPGGIYQLRTLVKEKVYSTQLIYEK